MSPKKKKPESTKSVIYSISNLLKFFIMSLIGIFMFFVPVFISGKESIMVDHAVTAITTNFPLFATLLSMGFIVIGGILPFYKKTWNNNRVTLIFSLLKLLSIVPACMVFFMYGPEWLLRDDMLPFLFTKIIIPVGIIVPIGSMLLTFLTGYGLMEFIGVIMHPIMRPVFKLPGRAAINAVVSFVGSFSIGIILTNKIYKEGKYTMKEAAIVAAGFSTVSASFMVIVAKASGLMGVWNLYFWSTFIITFIVSAITTRIWPLNKIPDTYVDGKQFEEPKAEGHLMATALREGLIVANDSEPIAKKMWMNFRDGFLINLRLVPTIMSIATMSFIVIKMTPVFDILAYVFYPFTWLLQIAEPFLLAKACAIVGADMFIPALIVAGAGAPMETKFAAAVISVSSILFLSGPIPIILATEIKLSLKDMIIILLERTLLTLLFVVPLAKLLF